MYLQQAYQRPEYARRLELKGRKQYLFRMHSFVQNLKLESDMQD